MKPDAKNTSPPLTLDPRENENGELVLSITGRLDAQNTAQAWNDALQIVDEKKPARLIVDASGIDYIDGSGIGLLIEIQRRQILARREAEIQGLKPSFERLLNEFSPKDFLHHDSPVAEPINIFEEAGKATVSFWRDTMALLSFVGELCYNLLYAFRHPRQIRWRDAFLIAEKAGVNALPIVGMIGFIMGLIMAYQSAIFMKWYGVELYVANLVGLSIIRELGPLLTAIVLAGRSGSAFAAELGTMKINEELNALTTMGLDPVRFLVVTRVIAAVIMMPLLTIYANFCGVFGGFVVMNLFGYPLSIYISQVTYAVTLTDLFGGLFKSLVFGLLVAGVGCMRGMETKLSAAGVGQSTTSAVVSGIFLITVADGIFAVVYYYLNI